MSYETKVLVVFVALVLVFNLAVVAFIWSRSRGSVDRAALRVVLWRLLSYTLILSGGLIWLVFRGSVAGIIGTALLLVAGLVTRFGSSIALFFRWRHR